MQRNNWTFHQTAASLLPHRADALLCSPIVVHQCMTQWITVHLICSTVNYCFTRTVHLCNLYGQCTVYSVHLCNICTLLMCVLAMTAFLFRVVASHMNSQSQPEQPTSNNSISSGRLLKWSQEATREPLQPFWWTLAMFQPQPLLVHRKKIK